MLVLSRKIGQSLIIGNDVVVRLLEIRGQQVRLGVEAPADVSVVREELHRVVAAANQEAAQPDDGALAALAATLRGAQGGKGVEP
ncbi:MAG TPA: carbon storage regulator CsrA [Acidobacteriota bacterium]|nr:carbon storage regulator CsrA [bacterium]HNX19400.1 carbon storage regulator CsrA [Acidobacteriota bacterium]